MVWDPQERQHRAWVGPALTATLTLTVLEVAVLIYGTVVTSLALAGDPSVRQANVVALALLTLVLWLGFACKGLVFLMAVRQVTDLLFAPDRLTDEIADTGQGSCLRRDGWLYELLAAVCFRKTKAYQLREAAKIFTKVRA